MLLEGLIAVLGSLGAGSAILAIRLIARRRADPRVGRSAFPLRGDVGDSMTHLCLIEAIRRNDGRLVNEVPNFLLGKKQDYPAIFHLLLARVPRTMLEKHEWLVTPTIEAAHVFMTGVLGFVVLAYLGVDHAGVWAGFVALLWGATPILLHADRRLTLGERPFGFIFTHGFFVFVFLWNVDDGLVWLCAAALCGSIAVCASKFGTQALVLVSTALGLILLDPFVLAPLAAAIVLAIVVSNGYAIRVARGTLRHSAHYRRHLMHIHDYVVGVNLRRFVDAAKLLLKRNRKAASIELQRHPIGVVLVRFIWLIPLGLATARWAEAPTVASAALPLLAWGWACLATCALTSTQIFKYLGEGHRYVELAVLPGILSCFLIPDAWGGLWWLALGLPTGYYAARALLSSPGIAIAPASIAGLLDFAGAAPAATYVTVPGRLAFPLAYESGEKHRFCWIFINMGDEREMEGFLSLFAGGAHYPYPGREGIDRAAACLGATRLAIWLPIVEQLRRFYGIEFPLDDLECEFSNGEYAIYVLPSDKAAEPPPL